MANAFRVSGLTKTYRDFVLDHVSFTVPSGSIVGLIGENLSPRKLNRVMKNIYRTWSEQEYLCLLKQFSLPANKQIRRFSKGMKMKYSSFP